MPSEGCFVLCGWTVCLMLRRDSSLVYDYRIIVVTGYLFILDYLNYPVTKDIG